MLLEYFPRSKLREALMGGWRLLPDVSYSPDEWAFLCFKCDQIEALTQAQLDRILYPFTGRDNRVLSNRSAARASNKTRGLRSANLKRWSRFRRLQEAGA